MPFAILEKIMYSMGTRRRSSIVLLITSRGDIMQTQQQTQKPTPLLQGKVVQKPLVLKQATPGLRFGKVKFGKDGCGY